MNRGRVFDAHERSLRRRVVSTATTGRVARGARSVGRATALASTTTASTAAAITLAHCYALSLGNFRPSHRVNTARHEWRERVQPTSGSNGTQGVWVVAGTPVAGVLGFADP